MVRRLSILFWVLAAAIPVGCGDSSSGDGGDSADDGTPGTGGGGGASCASDQTSCDGDCVDLETSSAHCGRCGEECALGTSCSMGECGSCPSGLESCTGTCTIVSDDPENCGACGQACVLGQACADGSCSCPEGSTSCDDACVNTTTDPANCGDCAEECARGQGCTDGACSCPEGTAACGGRCVDQTTSVEHCGECDSACVPGELCSDGACECLSGLTACGGECVDTESSAAHCGDCDTACAAREVCLSGGCETDCGSLTQCGQDCVDVTASARHCGDCDSPCPAGEACDGGACVCPMGLRRCGSACVSTTSDPENCGQCGEACVLGQSCIDGECACPMGQSVCSMRCVTTTSDPSNCGQCGTTCVTGQSCIDGECECPMGQVLCGNSCTSTTNNPQHCGACNNTCTGGRVCNGTSCECASGRSFCGGACVDTDTDEENCGDCGHECSTDQSCSFGTCSGGGGTGGGGGMSGAGGTGATSGMGGAGGSGGASGMGAMSGTGGTGGTGGGEVVPGYDLDTQYLTGVTGPTDIAFHSDGRAVVTLKAGTIVVRRTNGTIAMQTGAFPNIATGFEQGLLGVVADPNVGTNHRFYFYVTNGPTAADRIRVLRGTLGSNDSFTIDPSPLVDGIEVGMSQAGGGLAIAGGKLFVGVGDTGHNMTPPVNKLPQCLNQPTGKILRVNLDGSTPSDNPLVGIPMATSCTAYNSAWGTAAPDTRIYAWGLRNPWRFFIDSATDMLWIGDVGEVTREEISIGGSGSNFGWPFREGTIPYAGLDGKDCSIGLFPVVPCVAPVFEYPRTIGTSVTGGLIPSGCGWENVWGKPYYVFGDFSVDLILAVEVRSDRLGIVPSSTITLESNSNGPVSFRMGADQSMYVVMNQANAVYRFTPKTRTGAGCP